MLKRMYVLLQEAEPKVIILNLKEIIERKVDKSLDALFNQTEKLPTHQMHKNPVTWLEEYLS